MRSMITALIFIISFAPLPAQTLSTKLDPRLKMLVKAVRTKHAALTKITQADQSFIQVYIQGQPEAIRQAVLNAGGTVGTAIGNMVTASLPPSAIESLAQNPDITRVEKISLKTSKNDNVAAQSGIVPVHLGIPPLPQAYTGQGVIVGIIDTGIDFKHLDFRDPSDPSKTRILSIWDQNDRRGPQRPDGFDYGTLWTQADIEATLAGQNVVRHQDRIGHGSHVAGIATGNGSAVGAYRGIAPNADIIYVNGLGNVVDAVSYIFSEAQKLGRPVAVNYSAGDHFGPHDGTSLEEQMLDALVTEAPGRILFAAAGNEGDSFMHWGGVNLGPDSLWTYYHKDVFHSSVIADEEIGFIGPIDGINGVVYNTDAANTFLAVGLDSTSYISDSPVPTGYHGQTNWVSLQELVEREDVLTDTLRYQNGQIAGTLELSAQTWVDGKVVFSLSIFDHMSSINTDTERAIGADWWRLMAKGSGEIHVWSYLTLSAEHSSVNHVVSAPAYRPTDNRISVAIPATANNVIGVGASVASTLDNPNLTQGNLVTFSSRGPTADGRIKPELNAPGENVISTLSSLATPEKATTIGLHHWLSGTSMASPVATGIAALYLQKNPTATFTQIFAALTSWVTSDNLTASSGALPNSDWGYGKLNAFAALTTGAPIPALTDVDPLLSGQPALGTLINTDGVVAYRIDLNATTEIAVNISPSVGFDPMVTFFKGSSLSYITEANRVGDPINTAGLSSPERFQRTLETGHYLLIVSSAQGTTSGSFRIQMSRLTTLLSPGEVVKDQLAETNDKKIYQLAVENDADLTISLVSDANFSPILTLFKGTSAADTLAANRIDIHTQNTNNIARLIGPLEANTYILVAASQEGTGTFTLSADTFTSLTMGETKSSQLIESEGTRYHRLDLDQTTNVILSLSPIQDDFDVTLTLFNGTLISDASQSNWVDPPIDEYVRGWPEHWIGVLDPGSYLIAISSFRGRSAGTYTLELDTVNPLTLNTRQRGQLPAPNFWDFYRLDITKDTELSLTLSPASPLNTVLDIYSGTSLFDTTEENRVGVSLNTDEAGKSERFEGTLTTGSYIIWVSSFNGDSEGNYSLLALEAGAPLLGDFNNDGQVNFTDFILFAQNFGAPTINPGFNAQYDLNGDDTIGFPDFILFAQNFGG